MTGTAPESNYGTDDQETDDWHYGREAARRATDDDRSRCRICGDPILDHHDVRKGAHGGCYEQTMERDRPPHRGLQIQRRGQL